MRSCFPQILVLVLGALALGVLVFALLFTGMLTLVPATALGITFFSLTALLSGGGLLALTAALPRTDRTSSLVNAWQCCGELAAIGALGALLTSLVTFLSASLEIGLFIGVALIFSFLFLFFGGLVCFLQRYFTVRCGC